MFCHKVLNFQTEILASQSISDLTISHNQRGMGTLHWAKSWETEVFEYKENMQGSVIYTKSNLDRRLGNLWETSRSLS